MSDGYKKYVLVQKIRANRRGTLRHLAILAGSAVMSFAEAVEIVDSCDEEEILAFVKATFFGDAYIREDEL